MREITRQAVRLLEQAQTGDAHTALAEAEVELRAVTGDIADGPACMHFVRAVAYLTRGEPRLAIAATELMLHAAIREASGGWQAAALATRASQRLRLGEADAAEHNLDAVLHDLVAAEAVVAGEPDPVAAVNGRVAIAIGYYELRLYELVVPQFRTAYEMSSADAEQNGNRAMWLLNLAEIHLRWALELYQVGQVGEAESHTAEAEAYANARPPRSTGPTPTPGATTPCCSRPARAPTGGIRPVPRSTSPTTPSGWRNAASPAPR